MHKQKRKNGLSRPRTGLFVVLWASTYLAAYFGLNLVMQSMYRIFTFRPEDTRLLVVFFVASIGAMGQVQLVERLLRQSMRGWIAYSLVGTLITLLTFGRMTGGYDLSPLFYFFVLVLLMLPVPLLQTIWLWKRIDSAWIWAITPIITAFILLPLLLKMVANTDMRLDELLLVIGILANGLIQGSVMSHLWTQVRNTEKSKFDFASNTTEVEEARLDRLHTSEQKRIVVPRTADDEQADQHKIR